MMSAYIVLKSAVALISLWVFIFFFWKDYRIDTFREHVFSLRDRLFIYAADNKISFSDPAYAILRGRMNVALRYAHEFTMTRFLTFAAFRTPARNPDVERWEGAAAALRSATDREKLREFNTTLSIAILQLIVYRPFFLYIILRPLVGVASLLLHVDYPRRVLQKPEVASGVEHLESEAIEDARREDCEVVGVA
jgi:hypothetical protein